MTIEQLSKTQFAENLHTTFRILYEPERALDAELVELREGRGSPQHEVFALLFRTTNERVLPQRIYPFQHERLDAFELFIVPVGQDEQGTYYEAVLNRRVK